MDSFLSELSVQRFLDPLIYLKYCKHNGFWPSLSSTFSFIIYLSSLPKNAISINTVIYTHIHIPCFHIFPCSSFSSIFMEFQRLQYCLCFILFSLLYHGSQAYVFYAGGRDGWVLKPSEDYNHWAGRNRFEVNDTIVFKYKKGWNSVLVVNKEGYDKCNKTNPIKKFEDGYSVFQFDRSGPFYFISGTDDYCEKGQKLIVVVVAIRSPPYYPPSPSPVSPSPVSQPPVANQPSPAVSPYPSPKISPSSPPAPSVSPYPSPKISPSSSPSPAVSPAPANVPSYPTPASAPAPAPENTSPTPSPANTPAHSPTSPSPSPGTSTPAPSPTSPSPSPGASTPASSPPSPTSPSPSPATSTPEPSPPSPPASTPSSVPGPPGTPSPNPPGSSNPSSSNETSPPPPNGSGAWDLAPLSLLVYAIIFVMSAAVSGILGGQ